MVTKSEASQSTQVQANRTTGTVASSRTAEYTQEVRGGSSSRDAIDYIYILSASHSGSTLLTMLLASHPEIATVGETSAVLAVGDRDVGLCSCGDSVAHCRFWAAIREDMFRRGVDAAREEFGVEYRMPGHGLIDRALRAEFRGPLLELCRDVTLTMSTSWREREQAISKANRCLIESITEYRGSQHFVDSSKEAHRLKFMRRIGGLRTRVIHLMRDGRGVAASYMKKSQMSMADAVTDWTRSVRAQELILKTMNERDILQLRYEDLCSDVTGYMRRIFEFIGIEPKHDISNYHKADHHVLGNRMRLSGSAEIRLDEKWRTSLTAENLATFRSKAGAINHRYGYE